MSDLPVEINWTSEKVSSFKKAYAGSQKRKSAERAKMFTWEGYQFIPAYAAYLIQFLEDKFK